MPAKTVTKRTDTGGYYVTFEVQSGNRIELKLDGRSYGQLAEHDFGILRFQFSK